MRYLDKEQRSKIGFDYIIEKHNLLSPYGRKALAELTPFRPGMERELLREHSLMEAMKVLIGDRTFSGGLERALSKLKDISHSCANCGKGRILDEVELFELKIQGRIIEEVRVLLQGRGLDTLQLESVHEIIHILDPDRDDLPTYHIYSSYSPHLTEIRDEKRRIEEEIYRAGSHEEVEELRERRLRVVIEEQDEERIVRQTLSESLRPLMKSLTNNIEILGKLDLLYAKSRFIDRYNLRKPLISEEGGVEGRGLINLGIKDIVESSGKRYTPIDIQMNKGTTVITGANMGGKTVTLKTITLNVFLFHMGFYPMGDDVTMPLFDFIDFISDDMQDVSKGLSTFGAEMMKLKEIMFFLKRGRGFIALDEFARGTNPYEGQKIAGSLCDYLNDFDSFTLMATHYDGVVREGIAHYQVVGLRDVDFQSLKRKIDLNKKDSLGILQKYMDYRLEKSSGYQVPKDALNITMLLGIHEDFTRRILENYKGEEI